MSRRRPRSVSSAARPALSGTVAGTRSTSVARPDRTVKRGSIPLVVIMAIGLMLAAIGFLAITAIGRQGARAPASDRTGAYVGGDLHSLVVDPTEPNHIFIGGHDGAVESVDGGRTFRQMAALDSIDAMGWAVSADGRTMVVGGHNGLRISPDGGATWQDLTPKLPASDVHGLGMDPAAPSHWWAYLAGRGVYQTVNAGQNWSFLGGANLGIMGPILPVAGGDLLSTDMMSGLIRSKDGGRRWSKAADYMAMWLAADPKQPKLIWGASNGIAVSADGGSSWRTGPGWPTGATAVGVASDGRVYAGVLSGNRATVYVSQDDGSTWQHVG